MRAPKSRLAITALVVGVLLLGALGFRAWQEHRGSRPSRYLGDISLQLPPAR